jgi:hypothetical protein
LSSAGGASTWHAAKASGWRRAAWLAALLVTSWVAALLAGTLAGVVAGGAGDLIHMQGRGQPLPAVGQVLGEFPRTWGEAITSTARRVFMLDSDPWGLTALAWLFILGLIVSPMLLCMPLVGLQSRQGSGVPLRWSIIGAGSLGGLIAVGLVITMLDIPRLVARWNGASDPMSSVNEYGVVAMLLVVWVVAGVIWALLLARAGRRGHPDRITRFVRRLFAGTCVELALAAPTYALCMRRDSCWCSWFSWWSIVGGTIILTVLCGPMLVLLWTREARLQWLRHACPTCGYPCRSGSPVCTECGEPLPAARGDSLPA